MKSFVRNVGCNLLQRPFLPLSLKPYAYRCLRNLAVDHWRSQEVRRTDLDVAKLFDGQNSAGSHWTELGLLLGRLEAEELETIILKALLGLTFKEIARVRSISVNTVASRYRRSLERFKKMLGEKTHERNRETIESNTLGRGTCQS